MERQKLRILLADDDEGVRWAVKELLQASGHRVTEATDGADAFAVFERDRNGFDLLLTDFKMPRMTGTQLARGVRALRVDVPVIIMSGDVGSIIPKDHGCLVLGKSFTREQLEAAIAEAFAQAKRSSS